MTSLPKKFHRKTSSHSKKDSANLFLDATDQSDALYYLGLTYHFKGKELLANNAGVLTDAIRSLLKKSIVYYQ